MPVSKPRRKTTSHDVRRIRERREIQVRAQYRSRCLHDAMRDVLDAHGVEDLARALRHVAHLKGLPGREALQPYELEPRRILLGRRGWKLLGYDEFGDCERWVYTPSIPQGWDEDSTHRPTGLTWDGEVYTITPASGPGREPRGIHWFDNAIRFYMCLDEIESW
ncbi:hypothetical protein OK351_11340 [Glutamicibacter sp. MNS18]|uniref:hypothetical protein n=1 Tax=Glutamicibacter sp. MNS18 TaxID=2989817 RepID=UPI002235DCD4|nr:hypothetical protein [Glutamicibacter sp. MNS18]MCW4466096.1 hypothetical protein [Glutamicibacter sp. MNS18]